ncbi:FecR domain-containing protein [uncultured Parabacteroides sp.]|jgi:transmembrane sensor|uniref:FecR domain-containing protein n=1 Tax=uncultured Parabacteroides sp. TaxID=512312 RepID=UPI0025DE2691|nr:FecR domain-containing protein [uncultured Parabacteroides sp.]
MDEKQIPYELLAKYLSRQCTSTEREEIDRWLKEDSDHHILLEKLRRQWEGARIDTSAFVVPDKAAVWNNIQNRIQRKIKQVPMYSRSLLIRVSTVAAVIALVLGFSLSFLFNNQDESWQAAQFENVIMAPPGQKTQLVLPDGTLVWLNSGSRLSYNYQYSTRDRVVNLEGEAFFDVKKDTQYPFIVKAGEVDVKVHGTAFNVSAYADEENIMVALLRGKVSLLSAADQNVLTYLSPDQIATVSKMNLSCRVESCDAEIESSWHHNLLKFDGIPAGEVWKKLERWYGVDITLSNIDPSRVYWFTVKTESLTDLLEMINKITPIEYKLNGKEVTIRYK